VLALLTDVDAVLSFFPYQVARGKANVTTTSGTTYTVPTITLRFKRFLLFTFQDTFKVYLKELSKSVYIYSLVSDSGNSLEILFVLAEEKVKGGVKLEVGAVYNGQKAWIVEKFLGEVNRVLAERIGEEMERRARELKSQTQSVVAGKVDLSKLSVISKIVLKSKLAEQIELSIQPGRALDVMEELVGKYAGKYKGVYISGVSESASFRLLYLNGELAGVYVNSGGQTTSDEAALNELSGTFRINVYVSLTPISLQ
jgi:hypothetical protein